MFIDIVINSSYGACVSRTELKEEHVLGQTPEKFFYLDAGQSYISGMFFLAEAEGEGEAHLLSFMAQKHGQTILQEPSQNGYTK